MKLKQLEQEIFISFKETGFLLDKSSKFFQGILYVILEDYPKARDMMEECKKILTSASVDSVKEQSVITVFTAFVLNSSGEAERLFNTLSNNYGVELEYEKHPLIHAVRELRGSSNVLRPHKVATVISGHLSSM